MFYRVTSPFLFFLACSLVRLAVGFISFFPKANKQEMRKRFFFFCLEAQVLIEVLLPRPPRLPLLDESVSIETRLSVPFVPFLSPASPSLYLSHNCYPFYRASYLAHILAFGQTVSLYILPDIFFFFGSLFCLLVSFNPIHLHKQYSRFFS